MYKIYKIVDNTNDNVYIGITTQTLKERLKGHKHKITCSSREIIKNGDYRIELIEQTDDKTRERYHIQNTNCINAIKYNYNFDEKKYMKKYREKNKSKLLKNKKNYNKFRCSWGGDPKRHNNLLKIDPYLFN